MIFGFARGNKEVIGRLGEVAGQLRVLEECRKVAAKDLIELPRSLNWGFLGGFSNRTQNERSS